MQIFSRLAPFSGRARLAVPILALSLALAGCATVPPPDDSMNRAQNQLQAARDAGAADYAPVDLGFAQDRFQQAQAAMAARKYDDAANLAEESRADGELAQAKAGLGAARAHIQSRLQENSALRAQGEQDEQDSQRQDDQDQPMTAPAGSSSAPLPPAAPTGDMPAPASSVLTAPAPAGGFQTVPEDGQPGAGQQSDPNTHGGQS